MDIAGKTILLTGATGGIGQAIAMTLAKAGARLIITGRDQDKLNGLSTQLSNDQVIAVACDLSKACERKQLIQIAKEQQIDILMNNAGISQFSWLTDMNQATIEKVIETNLILPIQLCHELIPFLQTRPESAIVNIGSILGSIGYSGSSVYCATKFGLRGFTESLRRELADSSIRVIYFAPRATDTLFDQTMNNMNRELNIAIDHPVDVAAKLLATLKKKTPSNHYLGWPERFFVRINSIFPKLVDSSVRKQLPIIKKFAKNH